jgi:hypothetical protein
VPCHDRNKCCEIRSMLKMLQGNHRLSDCLKHGSRRSILVRLVRGNTTNPNREDGGNGRTGTRRTCSGRERCSMHRSHRWTPSWSSGSSHTCREHGIELTQRGLPFSLQRSTDTGRCVGVGSVAHEAAASAVACQLHVVHCMAGVRWESWRYLLDATHFRKSTHAV